jgi:hypothetical protein
MFHDINSKEVNLPIQNYSGPIWYLEFMQIEID